MKALGLTMTFKRTLTDNTVRVLMLISECTGKQAGVSAEVKINSVYFIYIYM